MNIIDERNVRTVHRKLRKKEYDDLLTLSVSDGTERVRLLDEGMVVDAGGRPYFYLMKGTLQKFMDALTDDYEGSINVGHMDFATFPFLIGKWTKRDLHLVDIGEGRMGLDVDLRLDENSLFVKELRRVPYTLGVSAEFSFHENEEFSKKFGIEILDEVFIGDFAIVGEAGNVNSSGIKLQGGKNMTVNDLVSAIETAEQPNLEAVTKKLDALLEAEETAETQEAAAETTEASEETQEAAAEETAEPQEVAAETQEAAEETREAAEEEYENLSAVAAAMESLAKENAELKAANEKLTAQLAAKSKTEQDFLARFKKLSVSVSTAKESVVMEDAAVAESDLQIVYTDGIGEV